MRENRQRAFDYLKSPACEGFKSNLPHDSETIWGVSKEWWPEIWQQLSDYLKGGQVTIALARCFDFYMAEFYHPVGADDLAYPLDIYAFVQAVNQGMNRVRNMLAASGGDIDKFFDLTTQRYHDIVAANPAKAEDLQGWLNRIERVKIAFPVTT